MKHFFVLNLYLLVEWYQSEAIIFRRFSDTGVFFFVIVIFIFKVNFRITLQNGEVSEGQL